MTESNATRNPRLGHVKADCYDFSKFIGRCLNISHKGICYSNRINTLICGYVGLFCFKKLMKGCDISWATRTLLGGDGQPLCCNETSLLSEGIFMTLWN